MLQYGKITKKLRILFLILLLIIMNLQFADAYFYNITYECKDDICIEGQKANWFVTIYNQGRRVVEYTTVELVDYVDGSNIVELKIPFYPLNSDRGDLIAIEQNEKVAINLTGTIPKANYQNNLVYYPCFTRTITDSYPIGRYGEYESRHCYEENLTMPVVQCISDENCNNNKICSFNACLKLNCGECQYIKNHACFDYECWPSEQCTSNEICKNNACETLNCRLNEYTENRTCKALNCNFDEYIANRTCKKLNCSYDEFVFNRTCKKLDCAENEFIEEHECRSCKDEEYAINYTCVPLSCSYNETVFNHTCNPLNCNFLQKAENHACVNNNSAIFKSILEVIAIIAIIVFLILDVRKYEIKHKKI